jgi:C-22 sterol desaturase
MASDNTLTRKILNSPNHTEPCLVASAKQVLDPTNWVFLTGKVHADYRKSLNVLFTRRALGIYLRVQEPIYKRYFQTWFETRKEAEPHMMEVRNLNMETSLRVFCGNYLPAHACEEISDKYWLITRALELVNFPLAVPGTKVYKAMQARKRVMYWFEFCSAESKKRMSQPGAEPECLLDAWIKEMVDARRWQEDKDAGKATAGEGKPLLVREYSDNEIGMVLLSFLFASQDAMTSGLIFAFQHMADYPEIFKKVRQEQLDVRGGDLEVPFTLEMLDQSPYLRAFVKETLRLKRMSVFARKQQKADLFGLQLRSSWFRTWQSVHSRSMDHIPSRRDPLLFPLSGTACTILRCTAIPIPSSLSGGCLAVSLRTATLPTTSSCVARLLCLT